MVEEFSKQFEVDCVKIKNAVSLQLPLEITSYTLPRNMEIYIRKVLEVFLKECHQEHMYEYLNFCLGELLTNAKKANTKRVYFTENNLDINNPDDYQKGMENFKIDTLTNIDYYLELQKKYGYYIKLDLQTTGEQIQVSIRNNAKITVFELDRIKNKIASVQQYKTMEEVFTNVLDQSEGAGLGIIIIILMLQKIGLSKENYQVITDENETITKITLPCNQKVFEGNSTLTHEFIQLQEQIPVLNDTFEKVRTIVSQEPINKNELLETLQLDATLTLLLLKNSVKINPKELNIEDALAFFNDDQLKEIFSPENPDLRIVEDNDVNKNLWEHSRKVAFFAYNLVKNRPELQNIITAKQAYTLGLVNQIGKILISNTTENQKEQLERIVENFEEKQKIIDIFYCGNANPQIAMIYTKKLGFDDYYNAIIGYWNNSGYIPDTIKSATYIIYLAELLEYYNEGIADYYQFKKEVLNSFGITTEDQIKHILCELLK